MAVSTTLQLNGGYYHVGKTEVIASGQGSFVTFNGCFNLTQSDEDDEIIFVTGSFVMTEGGLGPSQNITARQVDGGFIGSANRPDCDSLTPVPSMAPTTNAPSSLSPTNPVVPIIIDDGESHNLTRSDSGVALYQLLNSSMLSIEDFFTIIRAPGGLAEATPTFLIDDNSQIFLAGRNIFIIGSNGTSANENGGLAIQVTGGSRGHFENFGDTGTPLIIRGGDAIGEGVGGDALHFDGNGTQGSIISGNFVGGVGGNESSGFTIGHSLLVTNMAYVSVSGGKFYGSVMAKSTDLKLSGGYFHTEVIASGLDSTVTFDGCFELAQSDEDDEVIFVMGNFVYNDILGPVLNITAREVDGGLIEVNIHPDCNTIKTKPTSSPTITPPPQSLTPSPVAPPIPTPPNPPVDNGGNTLWFGFVSQVTFLFYMLLLVH